MAAPAGDWQNQLGPNARQRIVNKIMETPTMLREIAETIEQEAYTAAISQADYLQRLAMETMPQNPIGGGGGGGGVGGGGGPPGGGGGPPGGGVGEAAMDWRRHLELDSRQRIVNKIMETPTMLREIAERIEQEAYTAAISQSDYLRRLAMEAMPQNP